MERIKTTYAFLKEYIVPYFPFLLLLIFFTPTAGHGWDTECWTEWAKYHYQHGLCNIYKSWTDYLPLYHYILFAYAKMQPNIESVVLNIHYLKYITLFFEFMSTVILSRLLFNEFHDRYKSLFYSLFYLLNAGIIYNSLVWGQVDGIMSFFIFASVIAAYQKRAFLSLVCFVLALNLKLQAIIFLPLVIGLIIPAIPNSFKKIIYAFGGVLAIQFLIILPFIWVGDFPKLLNVVFGSVGKYPVVSMNAYNIWEYVFARNINLMQTPDSTLFLGITCKTWGLIFFFIASFGALSHFIKPTWNYLIKKEDVRFSFNRILLSATLIPLVFFYFNTQMHERYPHPAFIFLAAYSLLYKRLHLLVIGSFAYFLNLEDVLQVLHTNNYNTLIFMSRFIAGLYFLLIVLLYIDLYNPNLKSKCNGS